MHDIYTSWFPTYIHQVFTEIYRMICDNFTSRWYTSMRLFKWCYMYIKVSDIYTSRFCINIQHDSWYFYIKMVLIYGTFQVILYVHEDARYLFIKIPHTEIYYMIRNLRSIYTMTNEPFYIPDIYTGRWSNVMRGLQCAESVMCTAKRGSLGPSLGLKIWREEIQNSGDRYCTKPPAFFWLLVVKYDAWSYWGIKLWVRAKSGRKFWIPALRFYANSQFNDLFRM